MRLVGEVRDERCVWDRSVYKFDLIDGFAQGGSLRSRAVALTIVVTSWKVFSLYRYVKKVGIIN